MARNFFGSLRRWFDTAAAPKPAANQAQTISWIRIIPFIGLHVACLGVIWTGWSVFALLFALAMYLLRMFAITGFYHRYFSHKAFRTSRFIQFIFAVIGAAATQRGPLWWAAHHRDHHSHSDTPEDVHTPKHGFIWSHMGWFLCDHHFETKYERIPDIARYPELRWLDRYDLFVPVAFASAIFFLGWFLEIFVPQLGTGAWQLLVWGYFISTVALMHATLCINSLAHRFGKRRYSTPDRSRNNFWLALLTLGEGWHNNHHHYPGSARQGFFWWEIDVTYYLLRVMAALGLVWDIKPLPAIAKLNWRRKAPVEEGAS
ncbi:MAG: acyl-CoA desaturase [Gammaproteobacteria bacterium]|nr:acyl-CoA desaturase [Gammaproteobacteria bacterium]